MENPTLLLALSIFFASLPVAVWLYILFNKQERSKKTIALVFILGCLTAPTLLGIQYVWQEAPQFDLGKFIETNIHNQSTMFIAIFVLFGAMEEIIKHYVVRSVDKKTLLIQKVDDAIRYSMASALGFSFIENGYYLYQFWPSISIGELAGMYIFRSIFTTCAHLIFSGIFGYYFGIAKFSIDIRQQRNLSGEYSRATRLIQKLFKMAPSQAEQEKLVLKGLFIAIGIHAFYNYLLQFNMILPVLAIVGLGYLYLQYLLNRKTGQLILATDVSKRRKSLLASKDEDVIIELLGMWFNEKRYVDVIHICERLLERDPDNNVVKLFKARALDKMDDKNTYKKILSTIINTDKKPTDQSVIQSYLDQKEQLKKSQEQSSS